MTRLPSHCAARSDVWLVLECVNSAEPHNCKAAVMVGFDYFQVQVAPGATVRLEGAPVVLRVAPYGARGGGGVGCSHLTGVLPIREGRAAAAGAADATTSLSPAHDQRKVAIASHSGACAVVCDRPSLSLLTRVAEEEVLAGAAAPLKAATARKRVQRSRDNIFDWPESLEELEKWSIRAEEERMSCSLADEPFAGHVHLGVFRASVLITSRELIRTLRGVRCACFVPA